MSWTAPKTWVGGAGQYLLAADMNAHIRDNLSFLKTNIALETAVQLTVSSGVVTKSQSFHYISPESGTEDDLDTINGGTEGDVLLLTAEAGKTINITTDGNILGTGTLDGTNIAMLVYFGAYWNISLMDVTNAQEVVDAAIDTHEAAYNHALISTLYDMISAITIPEVLGFVIMSLPDAHGLYADATAKELRIRTSLAVEGENILVTQGYNWIDGGLRVTI